MFRKLTGIFILLCFLLIKNSPLFVFDTFKQPVLLANLSAHSGAEQENKTLPQESNELPEENKSSKQSECSDEDFIHQSTLNFIPVLHVFKGLDIHYSKQTSTAYFSLPHPPPDSNS